MNRWPMVTVFLVVVFAGCSEYGASRGLAGDGSPREFRPIDPKAAVFWVRTTAEVNDLFNTFVADYNASESTLLPIRAEYVGGYSEVYKKVLAGIHAGSLPAMAVAYESMTAEYVRAGAAEPVGDFMRDPELGFGMDEFDDFFPAVLEPNKFEQFDGRMYSFPFAKSVLMLYYNKTVLSQAGIDSPPATWDEFLSQCRIIKEKTGKQPYALDVDCSTVSGIIFSMGGEILESDFSLYDEPPAIQTFELFETLAREKLVYRIQPGSFDDHVAFAQDEAAFILRTSASRTGLGQLMGWDDDRWGISVIPQANPRDPRTLLFGPNIVIFRTGPEHAREAWRFIRYFTSQENTVRWALGTGYLPLRRSAAEHPDMQAFWGEWSGNRAAFDCLPFARTEPNRAGWQEVRGQVEGALEEVLAGVKTGRAAALELKRKADAVFAEAR